jgi:hypothetical protein
VQPASLLVSNVCSYSFKYALKKKHQSASFKNEWTFFYLENKTGTDVMIFKIFRPKNIAKKWRFRLKTKLNNAKF